ncbi:MAG TPA: hypothetical protein PKD55_17815 [Bellilinea sp.]|nr:hypothetical protein [Bellilinea sp.]
MATVRKDNGDLEKIRFEATVNQVRTLADGGIRVVFDLPEEAVPQMAMLAEVRRLGWILSVECGKTI